MLGTGFAQAFPILTSPILTRLYTPNDFGIFGMVMSVAAIISIIATGRYELAIILPRKDSDAGNLLFVSIGISLATSLFCLILIFFFNNTVIAFLNRPELKNFFYFLPFSVLLTSFYQTLRCYNNRLKNYKIISKSRFWESASTAFVTVLGGFYSLGVTSLILGSFLGTAVGIIYLFNSIKSKINVFDKRKMVVLSKKYSSFPKFDIPAAFFNAAAQQAPSFLLMPLFGASFAGHYFLVQKIFMMPIKLISTSIGEVFRQEAVHQQNSTGTFERLFCTTLKKLLLLSLIPFLAILVGGKEIFSCIFGSNWTDAGLQAQILAPMFMLKFVVSPLTYSLYIKNKLWVNLWGQLFYLVSVFVAVALAVYLKNSLLSVKLISGLISFVYLFYAYYSYLLSKKVD